MKRAVVIVTSLCLGLVAVARANSFTTLTFTADPGQPTILNGSTITIDPADNVVESWDFIDLTLIPSLPADAGFSQNSSLLAGTYDNFLTAPGSLLDSQIGPSATTGFTGSFAAYTFAFPLGFLDFVTPTSLDDEFVMWPNNDPTQTPLIIGHDIAGRWTDPPVPDAVTTFGLLLPVAGVMGFCRQRRMRLNRQ